MKIEFVLSARISFGLAVLRTLGAVTVFDRFHFVFVRFRALLAPVTVQ